MSKHNRHLTLSAVAGALFAIAAGPAAAQSSAASVAASAAERGNLWFVELTGKPVADGARLAAVQAEKAKFRLAARSARVNFVERRSYDTLFNGLSVEVGPAERARLARLPGVKAMYPVEIIAAPRPARGGETQPDLVAALSLTGADIAQNALGLSGAGVKVGIIDSGIDIDHPAFGGAGSNGATPFPTARVVAGYDFVGDAYNADPSSATYNPVPAPDANPDDCGGHGTHVAGIVGANGGGVLGVAPQASLGAYRVFGCNGSTSSDIILSALERALADGMQVINQSLGSGRQWPQYPTAQATGRLGKKGVVMVASIGNNGPGGSSPDALFAAGAPGVGDGVIGVASFDNAQRSFSAAGTPYGYITATGAPVAPSTGSLPMARLSPPAVPANSSTDACSALTPGSLTGQAVLVQRGGCTFLIKATNVQTAGAAAMVLYNNAAGALSPTVAGTPAITIPVVAITLREGTVLNAAIAAGPTTLEWAADYVAYPYGTGGLISGFSSFGLAADLSLKPNIGAPGGAILSTYPLEAGGTATLSGTSMSSPHVAGAAALILQALPNAAQGQAGPLRGAGSPPAVAMINRLQNHAKPKALSLSPDSGELDFSFRQGAGMMDIVAAVQAQTFVLPSQIALGESEGGPVTKTLTVRNTGTTAVTFDITHRPAVASGPNTQTGASYNITGPYVAPATATFSSPSVTVPAKGTATFDVTIAANDGLVNRGLYGGYVTLTPQGGGNVVSVPYAGFKGDYQSTVVLTPTANNFPWLSRPTATGYTNCPAGCTYSMGPAAVVTSADIPVVVAHLDHPSRQIRFEAFDATTDQSVGIIGIDDYVTRNATPGGFFTWPWDGTTATAPGGVPNGTYKLRLSVLKALGDASNPAHWEVFSSAVATIARP